MLCSPSFASRCRNRSTMRQCNARHRCAGLAALLENLSLRVIVVSATGGRLGVFHGAHLSSGGHHRRRWPTVLKTGSPDAYRDSPKNRLNLVGAMRILKLPFPIEMHTPDVRMIPHYTA